MNISTKESTWKVWDEEIKGLYKYYNGESCLTDYFTEEEQMK